MKRLSLLLAAVVALSGCVVHETYREPYYGDGGYYEGSSRGYASAGNGGYYEDGNPGGDYYYGYEYDRYYDYSWSAYVEYPFYYSLFWPLNHWYYDPFLYPGYYYGVTWFPRSYFSVSYSYGYAHHHWPRYYGYLAYSPYRYAWVDNYYDNRPWRHGGYSRPSRDYDRYYPLPRYGSAYNEAERLAVARRTANRPVPSGGYGNTSFQGVSSRAGIRNNNAANPTRYPAEATRGGVVRTPSNSGARSADHYGSGSTRRDPGVRVFDSSTANGARNPNPGREPRVNATTPSTRATPSATPATRDTSRMPQARPSAPERSNVRTTTSPQSGSSVNALPSRSVPNPSMPSRNTDAPQRNSLPAVERATPSRDYSRPATTQPSAPIYRSAPAPQRVEPSYRPSTPAPSHSAPDPTPSRSQPSYRAPESSRPSKSEDHSPSSSSSDRGESRSSGEVRRVGSNRR